MNFFKTVKANIIFPSYSARSITNHYFFIGLVLFFSLQNITFAQNNTPKEYEPVTLQLKWFHQFQFAGYYAAKYKGFYKDEGLDVKILEFKGQKTQLNPAESDDVDYAISDSSIVVDYANGSKISILAAMFQHDPLVFISKRSSHIISPYEMAGKRIMFDTHFGNEASLRALLYLSDISESNATFLNHSYNKDDLIQDKVDVMSAYLTDQVYYYKERGIALNIINPQNYGIDFYGDLLVTSQKEIIEHPGRAERFKRASLKGWQYALEHTEEMIDLIKNIYHSKLSIKNLRFEARETYQVIMPDKVPLGHIDVNRLRRVSEIYAQLKLAPPLNQTQLQKLVYGSQTHLKLTSDEQQWLDQHPIIKVGVDPDFAPFEWMDENNQLHGMNFEYLQLLEKELGIQFQITNTNSWQQTLNMAKAGKVDMLSDANKTPEREKYLLFSDTYIETPVVIINDIKNGFIGSLDRLKGKKIVLEDGYFLNDLIKKEYPEISIITTENGFEALDYLNLGLADAYIGDAIYANFLIQKKGLLNLRISGTTQYKNQHRFAVPKDRTLLLSILQKALSKLSKKQKEQILYKWRGLHVEHGITIKQLLYATAIISLIFLIFVYWLFRLNREILQRKKIEQALTESESRFRKIFEATDAIAVQGYSKSREVIYWNSASETLYGYSATMALGKKLEDLIIPDEMREPVIDATNNWLNGGPGIPSSELTLKKADGSPIDVFSSHILLQNINNEPEMYCIDIDMSLHKEQAQKIEHQAFFDTLTDLPNRFLVLDRLSQLLNKAKRNSEKVAVLFLDLDDFKKVNDTLGHETGDRLLIEAAKRLQAVIRSNDTVGRLGGDEFIMLIDSLKQISEVQPIIENLLSQFRKPFKIKNRELILTASIGIAIYPDDSKNASTLLSNADSAMYHAKKHGRNTFSYFTQKMNKEASRRLILDEQMHGALARNEFEVYFQAKINIASGKLNGAEALLRWNNPALGSISPEEFIPISEQTGLIISIGEFVLQQAIKQTIVWQKTYQKDFTIAINLSPRQFRDPGLVDTIHTIINNSELSAESLELEITEGVLMSGHNYIKEALTQLSNMGINIALDDFGTGYSSLNYLRNYPFNVLKIDRSFIQDITTDPADKELVNATIAMAHGLKLKVVAEGVETREQLNQLIKLNCDIAQGYYYSKPLPASEFSQLLESGF